MLLRCFWATCYPPRCGLQVLLEDTPARWLAIASIVQHHVAWRIACSARVLRLVWQSDCQ